jgi:ACT domain-containing protein
MKGVITVLGKDKVGIIAQVCTKLAQCSVNILDISQTILQDYFTMVMIVDCSATPFGMDQLVVELEELGQTIGVEIRFRRDDIFQAMHRI